MKKFKRIMALVIALAMVLGMMSITAFAADTGSITIKSNETVDVDGRTFNAYKILDATYSGTGDDFTIAYTVPALMKNFYENYADFKVDGKNITTQAAEAGKTFDLVVSEKIAAITKAADMQKFIKAALAYIKTLSSTDQASLLKGSATGSSGTAKITPLVTGYYLVEDTGTKEPVSAIMLDTVTDANVDIVIKASIPTPDKQIVVTDNSGNVVTDENGNITTLDDTNNAGVGSTVNYEITQNIPNYTGYDHYYFILNDTLSNGLTFNDDIKVYVDVNGNGKFEDTITKYTFDRHNGDVGDTITSFDYTSEKLTAGTDYYLYKATDNPSQSEGKTFQIAFADVKKFPIDAKIKVTYSANVNASALTGVVGNPNTVQIQYSNDPSKSEQPDTENVPGKPNSTQDHPLGDGPTDVTVTYTTELVLTKTDDSDTPKPLAGVQFTLTGTARQAAVKEEVTYDVDPAGTYYLLKTGKYTETAPTTTSTMVAAEAGATSGYVEDATYTGADAVVVNSKVYRPYKATDAGTGNTVYVLQLANDDLYVSTVVKYKKATAMTANTGDPVPVTMVAETDENGKISFAQLAAGTYTLSETKVPAGYNKAEDITFTIDWTGPTVDAEHPLTVATECTWTKNTTNTSNKNDTGITLVTEGEHKGEFTITLVNQKGKELPSTGGIGTTIFYVIGAILVIGAGVVLITRRRMEA